FNSTLRPSFILLLSRPLHSSPLFPYTTLFRSKLDKPKSPGMKYRHYSPELPLLLVEGDTAYMQKQINLKRETYGRVGVLASNRMAKQLTADEIIPLGDHINDIASHLYDGLRTFKQGHVNIILCEAFEKKEIGVAVMNRLEKAASSYLKEK